MEIQKIIEFRDAEFYCTGFLTKHSLRLLISKGMFQILYKEDKVDVHLCPP
jgi:hypothetical protein